jgi:hypothetical protein
MKNKTKREMSELVVKLYELLQGQRDMVRVYSKAFQSDLCFINPERLHSDLIPADCPVYTTRELAHILSLPDEELKQFHYLKMRMVG